MIVIGDVKSGIFNGGSRLVCVTVVGIHFLPETKIILASYKRNYRLSGSRDGFVPFDEPEHEYEHFCCNWRVLTCIVSVRTKSV